MDRSEAKKVVDAHIEALMGRLGVPHWKIVVDYDLRDDLANGQCDWNTIYNQAKISLDPDNIEKPEHLLKVLRHEIFHVLLSPYSVFHAAVEPLYDDDPVKKAMVEGVHRYAMEQAVINLERMYQGLTGAKSCRSTRSGTAATSAADKKPTSRPTRRRRR